MVTTPTEPVLSPLPKNPPDFLRSSRRSRRRRQEAQAAAHAAHVARLHIRVDVVGKVGGAVLAGHLEQQAVVLGVRPVEVFRDGIGGDGVLEAAAVGVPFDHDLDERLVDHIHLFLAVLILEVLLLAPDDGGQLGKVCRHRPVQRDVGEGRLRAPAAGGVHAVDEGLDALFHLLVVEVVRLDEGREIGVEGGERLRARPFVLHDAEEVDHLVAQRRQVLGGRRGDLARDAAQPFLDELFERPARAVAGEHGEVVDVDLGVAVRVGDLLVVDLRQPVVGGDRAAVGEDQPAHRIGHGRILLDPPVGRLHIAVHQLLVVEQRALHVADLFPLFAVEDVALGHVGVARLPQHLLDAVLDVLDGDLPVLDLGLEVGRHLQSQQVDHARVILLLHGVERLCDRDGDLPDVKFGDLAVSLDDLIHDTLSFPPYRGRAASFVR